jgi:hypothetical protein
MLLRLSFIGLHSPRNGLVCIVNKKDGVSHLLYPVFFPGSVYKIRIRLIHRAVVQTWSTSPFISEARNVCSENYTVGMQNGLPGPEGQHDAGASV